MKKLLGIVVLGLLLSTNAFAGKKWGQGELKLSPNVVKYFIQYLKGSHAQSPYLFAVSKDGLGFQYYICSQGLNNCSGGKTRILEECEGYSNGVECSLFARNRIIKWKNGINPGKGKESKIYSKWSNSEIEAKLTELGFLGGETKEIEKKETKKTEKKETKKTEKTEYQKQKAKDECKELGFAKGTEDFGDCVIIMLLK